MINELSAYPEIKKYNLINLYSNEEILVTYEKLLEVFGDELPKIMSNRSDSWTVEDI